MQLLFALLTILASANAGAVLTQCEQTNLAPATGELTRYIILMAEAATPSAGLAVCAQYQIAPASANLTPDQIAELLGVILALLALAFVFRVIKKTLFPSI